MGKRVENCSECPFYYCEYETDDFEVCHFEGPEGFAPCEEDMYISSGNDDDFVNNYIPLESYDYD